MKLFSLPVLGLALLVAVAVILLFWARHEVAIIPFADGTDDIGIDTVIKPGPMKFVEAPENHPPPIILIGPFHWHIRYALLREDLYAITDPTKLEIIINPNVPLDQFKETVMHELFHACIYLGNGGSSPAGRLIGDDAFIEATAPAFLFVLENNPDLVRWLQQKNF